MRVRYENLIYQKNNLIKNYYPLHFVPQLPQEGENTKDA